MHNPSISLVLVRVRILVARSLGYPVLILPYPNACKCKTTIPLISLHAHYFLLCGTNRIRNAFSATSLALESRLDAPGIRNLPPFRPM